MKAPASVQASSPYGALSLPKRLSLSLDETLRANVGEREKTGETSSLSPSDGPLRFVTSLSRFAPISANHWKVKRPGAFGGYLEKPLETESLFAGWILDFYVFWGVHSRALEV